MPVTQVRIILLIISVITAWKQTFDVLYFWSPVKVVVCFP